MATEKDPYQKVCKYKFCTKKEFTAKRTNQEYCCHDHNIKHNNGKAKVLRDATKMRDYRFHQNWLILSELFTGGTTELKGSTLEEKGYVISIFTHYKKIKDTKLNVLYSYEYGLEPIGNNSYKIIKDESKLH